MMETSCIVDRKTGKSVCPLKSVEVKGTIGDELAEVVVVQNFLNDRQNSIEAIYTFPLPHRASVNGFSARVGEKEITGQIKEKEEAFRGYDAAVRRGDSGFLLESHRPDIFQISLGSILPKEKVSVTISYIQDIESTDNEIRWMLPTVIAPRYIPGKYKGTKTGPGYANPTDMVPDGDYITPPVGDAPYTIKVDIDICCVAGIEKITSPSHTIEVYRGNDGETSVSLANKDELLDRDYVLIIGLGNEYKDLFKVPHKDQSGSYGYIKFCPQLECRFDNKVKHEYIFIIDVSGSMGGEKLRQAKRALGICLRNLIDGDRFNIIAFESDFTVFSRQSVIYSQDSLNRADKWISLLEDMGGTEIYNPMHFVLEEMKTYEGYERVVLLFTDGQVGNEEDVISLVKTHSKYLTLYSFGIDTAVNKYFIDGLAEAGNGMPEYIYPGERIDDKVIRQFARIHEPCISNPCIKSLEGRDIEVVPKMPSRLYASDSYSFVIKSDGLELLNSISIEGTYGDEPYIHVINAECQGDPGLLKLKWAKGKIRMLEGMLGSGNGRRDQLIKEEIIDISITYGILSALTSFVALYKRNINEMGLPEVVVVPVCPPRGWELDYINEAHQDFYVMSAVPDFSEDSGFMDYCMDGSVNELTVPLFLKNCRVESSGEPEYLSCQCMPMDCDGLWDDEEINVQNENSTVKERLHDAFRRAGEIQNADGSFGSKDDRRKKTAIYVIGMLLSQGDWKPYRIQIMKAGSVLAEGDGCKSLIECIAIHLIIENKLYRDISMENRLNIFLDNLKVSERTLYNEAINGEIAGLLQKIGLVTAIQSEDNAEYGIELLEHVII